MIEGLIKYLPETLADHPFILWALEITISILVIVVFTKLLLAFVKRGLFDYLPIDEKIKVTLKDLISTIVHVISGFMIILTLLDSVGINTASILATAGIGGVAIGFGAQSLVKDFFSGLFILLEGQYLIGDEVEIRGISGEVINFGLRSTTIQDYSTGAVHTFPNGTIDHVENRSRLDQYSILTVDVPEFYDMDTLMKDVRQSAATFETDERVVTGPIVQGIIDSPEKYNTVRIRTVVQNGELYQFTRDIRYKVLEDLAEKGYVLNSPVIIERNTDVSI